MPIASSIGFLLITLALAGAALTYHHYHTKKRSQAKEESSSARNDSESSPNDDKSQIQEYQQRLKDFETKLEKCTKRLDDSNKERDAAIESADCLKKSHDDARIQTKNLQNQLEDSEIRLENSRKRLEDSTNERDAAKISANRLEKRADDAKSQANSLQKQLDDSRTNHEVEMTKLQTVEDQQRAENVALQAEKSTLKMESSKTLQKASNLEKELRNLQDAVKSSNRKLEHSRKSEAQAIAGRKAAERIMSDHELEYASNTHFLEMKLEASGKENARLAEKPKELDKFHHAKMRQLRQTSEENASAAISLNLVKQQQRESGQIIQQLRQKLRVKQDEDVAIAVKLSSAKNELSTLQVTAAALQAENEQLREEKLKWASDKLELQSNVKSFEKDLKDAKKEVESLHGNLKHAREACGPQEQGLSDAKSTLSVTTALTMLLTPSPTPPPPSLPVSKTDEVVLSESKEVSKVISSKKLVPPIGKWEGDNTPQNPGSNANATTNCSSVAEVEPKFPPNPATDVLPQAEDTVPEAPDSAGRTQDVGVPPQTGPSNGQAKLQLNPTRPHLAPDSNTNSSTLFPTAQFATKKASHDKLDENPSKCHEHGPSGNSQAFSTLAEPKSQSMYPDPILGDLMEVDNEDPGPPSYIPSEYRAKICFQERSRLSQVPLTGGSFPHSPTISFCGQIKPAVDQTPVASVAAHFAGFSQEQNAASGAPVILGSSFSNPTATSLSTTTPDPIEADKTKPKVSPKPELRKPIIEYWRKRCTGESEAKKMFKQDMNSYKKKSEAQAAGNGTATTCEGVATASDENAKTGAELSPVQADPLAGLLVDVNEPYPELPDLDEDGNLCSPKGPATRGDTNLKAVPSPLQPEPSVGSFMDGNTPYPEFPDFDDEDILCDPASHTDEISSNAMEETWGSQGCVSSDETDGNSIIGDWHRNILEQTISVEVSMLFAVEVSFALTASRRSKYSITFDPVALNRQKYRNGGLKTTMSIWMETLDPKTLSWTEEMVMRTVTLRCQVLHQHDQQQCVQLMPCIRVVVANQSAM